MKGGGAWVHAQAPVNLGIETSKTYMH